MSTQYTPPWRKPDDLRNFTNPIQVHVREEMSNSAAEKAAEESVGVSDWNRWYEMYNDEARRAAEEQRLWSAQQAQQQMEFQEKMANTVYQRAVADMRAAGLNPALLYSHGGGQSPAPAGAMASTQVADVYKQNDPLVLLTGLLNLLGTALTSVSNIIGKAIPSKHIRV